MALLVNDLGGDAGFGEFVLEANDDGSTDAIDLTPVFANGFNFFGTTFSEIYLNNNGNATFGNFLSSYTPFGITESEIPIIAPFFADVDTRGGSTAATAGGTSTGSNLVYYDLDVANHAFTATWDDVGYYNSAIDKLNAFQLRIQQIGEPDEGNFRITFTYENIDWTTGNSSGGAQGLGGTVARAGYSAGDLTNFFELGQSGDQGRMLDLEAAPGVISFDVINGAVNALPVAEADTANTTAGQAVTIDVLANDYDPDGVIESVTITTTTSNGTLSFADDTPAFADIRYTPNAGFVGTDTFNYEIEDEDGGVSIGTVTVSVAAPSVGVELRGTAASDIVTGTAFADKLNGLNGADKLFGLGGDDQLIGSVGNDLLYGGEGADRLVGGGDNDTMNGGAGKDTLIGGVGADLLYGGLGVDILKGDAGADTFIFSSNDSSRERDRILDFQDGVDKIGLLTADGDFTYAVRATNAGAVVTFSTGDSVFLKGISASLVTADDFVTHDEASAATVWAGLMAA